MGSVLALALSLSLAVPTTGAVTIAELMAQIQALQAQLTTLQGAGTGAATACTFTKNLYLRVSDPQVKCLQQYLNGAGYPVSASGVGSAGSETNYYGAKTKAAVSKWQAANAVSPATGYFGSISRAKYSAVAGAPAGAPAAGVPVTPVAGGLSVALSPSTPASRSIVVGAANMPFGKWDFTAGSGDVTLTSLKFTRSGISSDAELGSAYLYDADSGDYISQYTGLGSGVLSFSNTGGLFTVKAGVTKHVELRMDVSSSASNNHTMAWVLNAASDVTSNATSVSGTFPTTSNAMAFVSVTNPSIATLTATTVATGNSVNAGTTGYLAGSFTLQAANSAVLLDRIVLTQNGSIISGTDVSNIKLVTTGGAQVGPTLTNLKSDGTGTFVMSPAYEIPSGQTIQINVYADVLAGVNRTMKFNVLNLRDVQARDKTYSIGVNPSASVAMTQTTVQAGTLTVTLDPSSPTGNIAPGQTNVTVAKFKVTSYGEQVKVLFVPFRITMTSAGTDFTDDVDNAYLVDDAGNQIGTTITAPCGGTACGTTGIWDSTDTVAATFGTAAAPINYLIPANTTRVWSLKLDVLSAGNGTDLAARLNTGSSNYQGQVSLSTGSTTSVSGNTLTITSNPFQAKLNQAYGTQQFAKGQTNAKIASYVFSASSAEGINVSTITFTSTTTLGTVAKYNNLSVKVDGVQFGSIQGSVADATDYTFSGSSPKLIPAGGSITVDVYADLINSSTAFPGGETAYYIKLKNASAVGATTATTQTLKNTSGTAISSSNISGQSATVNVTGGSMAIASDASTPAAYQGIMGKTGQSLGIFRFTGTAVSDTNITDLTVSDRLTTAGQNASFANLQWYKGGVAVGPVVAAGTASTEAGSTTGYRYTFHFGSPVVISQNVGTSLELRGDIASYASGGATSNSVHTLRIESPTDVTALSAGGSLAVTATGFAATSTVAVNPITVTRTKLTVASDATGITTSGHVSSAADVMAVFVFTADPAYDVTINTVTLKLAGSTLASVVVKLIDADTGAIWGSSATVGQLYNVASGATSSVSFFPNYVLSGGATKKVKVQVDTTGSTNMRDGNNQDLDRPFTATTGSTNGTQAQWYIDNETSTTGTSLGVTNAVCWGDGTTLCSAGGFNLETKVLPVYGPSVRY
ncbi:peptidoglycan-binding protein [Candidatus Azambacteria bacterium]|nr:peptidoglycan-binding protein [Candidatus Azambacteria bacterium]